MLCGAVCSHCTALNSFAFLVLLSVIVCLSLPCQLLLLTAVSEHSSIILLTFNLLLLICRQPHNEACAKLSQEYK